MKQNYCTLFDSNYLTRALVMYDSMTNSHMDFHLYIFAFDNLVLDFFTNKFIKSNITVVPLSEFEDDKLLAVKPFRTPGEYCWTSTPSVILYSIKKFNLDSCTYIDADLYFYTDPNILIQEMNDKSILLTEHRFTKEYEDKIENGIYCVQFMTFKNTNSGIEALTWWRDACLDWCFARSEDGKFGDQKYLDDWLVRFDGVHILKNLGGGMAPWNVQQYSFFKKEDTIKGVVNNNGENFSLVFFHFHSLKFYSNGTVWISNYPTPISALEYIYNPYIKALVKKQKELNSLLPGIDCMGTLIESNALLKYNWSLFIYFYWMDFKTAMKYLLGLNLKKNFQEFNLYPLKNFN